jgi:glucosamine--fructose-6-phosphate aminotransferase (isomerizing)
VLIDATGAASLRGIATETLVLPTVDPFATPVLNAIPVRSPAYHVAVLKALT